MFKIRFWPITAKPIRPISALKTHLVRKIIEPRILTFLSCFRPLLNVISFAKTNLKFMVEKMQIAVDDAKKIVKVTHGCHSPIHGKWPRTIARNSEHADKDEQVIGCGIVNEWDTVFFRYFTFVFTLNTAYEREKNIAYLYRIIFRTVDVASLINWIEDEWTHFLVARMFLFLSRASPSKKTNLFKLKTNTVIHSLCLILWKIRFFVIKRR